MGMKKTSPASAPLSIPPVQNEVSTVGRREGRRLCVFASCAFLQLLQTLMPIKYTNTLPVASTLWVKQ
jgi:hypothetical protein